jgi:3-oxoacyl-[acyl-carrier-protein] synthase-1
VSAACIRAAALARGTDFRETASALRARAGLEPAEWACLPCIVGSSSHGIGLVESDPRAELAPPIEFARGLARAFEVSGPVLSTSSACTSGLAALQLALDLMHAGAFRHALVLGAELSNRLTLAGFTGLGLVPGMTLGEALGAVVVSREGAWRIASLAWQLDPASLTGVSPDGHTLAQAMRDALSAAAWSASDVDLVKLASGNAENDHAEARALSAVFAPLPRGISLKGELGHTLGASGPAELALLLERLAHGGERRVLFNLAGFGGSVASMALERAG